MGGSRTSPTSSCTPVAQSSRRPSTTGSASSCTWVCGTSTWSNPTPRMAGGWTHCCASSHEHPFPQQARSSTVRRTTRGHRHTVAHRATRRRTARRESGHPRHRTVPGTRRFGVQATNRARGASANPRLRRARRRAAKTTARHERGSPKMAGAVERDHLINGEAIANLGWRQGSILCDIDVLGLVDRRSRAGSWKRCGGRSAGCRDCPETDQKFLSFARSTWCSFRPGCAGFICRSNAAVLTAFCSSPVSLAKLSVKVSAMRNCIPTADSRNRDPAARTAPC